MNRRDIFIGFLLGLVLLWTAAFLGLYNWQAQRFKETRKQLEHARDMARIERQFLNEQQQISSAVHSSGPPAPGRTYSILAELAQTAGVELHEVAIRNQSAKAAEPIPPIQASLVGDYNGILRFFTLMREQPGVTLIHIGLTNTGGVPARSIRASLHFTLTSSEEVRP